MVKTVETTFAFDTSFLDLNLEMMFHGDIEVPSRLTRQMYAAQKPDQVPIRRTIL